MHLCCGGLGMCHCVQNQFVNWHCLCLDPYCHILWRCSHLSSTQVPKATARLTVKLMLTLSRPKKREALTANRRDSLPI